MLKEILKSILTEEQREAGFYLEEDEDFVYLYDSLGRVRARFNSVGAMPDYVRDIAQRTMLGLR